jgi:hypothetical protein
MPITSSKPRHGHNGTKGRRGLIFNKIKIKIKKTRGLKVVLDGAETDGEKCLVKDSRGEN